MMSQATHCACCDRQSRQEVLFSAKDADQGYDVFELHRCQLCGVVSTWPRPSSQRLDEAYRDTRYYGRADAKFTSLLEAWLRFRARRRALSMVERSGRNGGTLRVLDIGAGRGLLMDAFGSLGHEVQGVERPGSPFSEHTNIVCGEFSKLKSHIGSFDVVVIWHVLEHLDDPAGMLRDVFDVLAPNGQLFIAVPNISSNQAKMFERCWFHLDLPRHLFHFDPVSLATLLERSGFLVAEQTTFSLEDGVYGFVQSALNCLPFLKPNYLYQSLKAGMNWRSLIVVVAHSPLALPLSLAALVETAVSPSLGRGACVVVRVEKVAG